MLKNGLPVINAQFLTYEMRNVIGDDQGGLYHALIGTLLVTGTATLISVPIGIFCAIYLVEYGKKNRLARIITFLVDVMTGIPSIVAGLFALSLFVLIFGPGGPLRLRRLRRAVAADDPDRGPLHRGDAAAGAGRPARGVVRPRRPEVAHHLEGGLPTALGGIVTGVMLAISRVIGETAPLLVVAGFTDSVNTNLFGGRMMTLPVFIFTQYSTLHGEGLRVRAGEARSS